MPSKKIKISELPLVESLKGLYTIGYKIIDGIKTSVKVSLEDIQTAYQDVVNAIKKSEEAAKNANNAATTANEKAVLADTAAANANDTAEHPTYIGQDHYVYKWNKTAQAYDKTDIYTKGDAFSIKKVYASVANMEADKSNPDITEGDFVLVNTGDVEDPDNAKLYVKADGDFEFLVDMSGAIGFTGKTPQFSMGTVTTLEAGASAIVTVSDDGTDDGGNPKYKINFAIPRGNPGAPFRVSGEYATLEALKSAVPDGSAVDGFMAVGTEAPYDYYAWVNGDWVNQGKIAGGGSGNVVIVPIMGLTTQSTSDEIFNAFGGKQNLIDIIKKVKDEDCVVIAKTDDDPNAVVQQTFSVVNATYVNDNNLILGLISWSVNVTSQMIIQVIDGVASYNEISTPLMTEAPSDGNVYGRKNKDWVKVPENSNVIILPKEILDLTGSSSSEEILAAFGGIDKYKDLFEKLSTNNCLVQIGEPSLGSLRHIYTLVEYTVKFASNKQWGALGFNIYNEEQQLRRLHFYLENNGTTARCGEASTFQLVRDTDVLTKDNTTAYTPTQHYHPATKAYADNIGYGRTITTTADKFLNTANLSGVDAEQRVIDLFGSLDYFKNVVANILANHVRYYFHFGDNPNNICVELGCVNACRANNNSSHELNFIITYYDENNLYTNRIYIVVNNDTAASKVIIASLVNSDNVATLTKKTSTEYSNINPKADNTAYLVTDD